MATYPRAAIVDNALRNLAIGIDLACIKPSATQGSAVELRLCGIAEAAPSLNISQTRFDEIDRRSAVAHDCDAITIAMHRFL
jgi:hypothetical protein